MIASVLAHFASEEKRAEGREGDAQGRLPATNAINGTMLALSALDCAYPCATIKRIQATHAPEGRSQTQQHHARI